MAKEIKFTTFVRCSSYNVALIGDSRVGKSTFIELLQRMFSTSENDEPYRGTVHPEVKTLYHYDPENKSHVCLNILDTPGLNEVPVDGTARPNEQLKDIISSHIKEHFSSIDLIFITLQKKGITENVISSIFDVKDFFGTKYIDHLCLLITFCDDFTKEDEEAYVEKLEKNDSVYEFMRRINKRILFSGKNKPKDSTKEDLHFLEQQNRRRNEFLTLLKNSQNSELRKNVDLNDIRPIDILESAAATNNDIMRLDEFNLKDYNEMFSLLDTLRKLSLMDEDRGEADEFIESVGGAFRQYEFVRVTEEERIAARNYTEAELPLKKKAEELREESYLFKSQLKVIRDTLHRFRLREIVPKKSVALSSSKLVIQAPKSNRK